jgi:hypothetical protein
MLLLGFHTGCDEITQCVAVLLALSRSRATERKRGEIKERPEGLIREK